MARTAAQRRARIMLRRYLEREMILREQEATSESITPPPSESSSEVQVVPAWEQQGASKSSPKHQIVPTSDQQVASDASPELQAVPTWQQQETTESTRPSSMVSGTKLQIVPTWKRRPGLGSICKKCHRRKRHGRRHARR